MLKYFYIILLLFLSFFLSSKVNAQETFSTRLTNESKGVVYNKEFTFNFTAHTNGFLALSANFGKIKTYYKTKYFHVEIGALKHNKEYKIRQIRNGSFGGANSYIYGKKNSLFVLRAGRGTKLYLSEKAEHRGLAIGLSYEYGPSLGIIKPYYLNIDDTVDGSSVQNIRAIKYSSENAEAFLTRDVVRGRSGFTQGLNELSFAPGLHGKFGFHFDWGAFDEYVKAIEVGIMVDVFFRNIPLMVNDATHVNPAINSTNIQNRPYFLNLYVSLQLGKRS